MRIMGFIMVCALTACNQDEGPQRTTSSGIVAGRITTASGSPVAGAAVTVTAVQPGAGSAVVGDCVGAVIPQSFVDTANATGHYSITVASGLTFATTLCVHLQASTPLVTATRSGISLKTGETAVVNVTLSES